MNKRTTVILSALIALAVFAGGAFFYERANRDAAAPPVVGDALVRPHSPIIGPADAPVTIVEFFDPSCEACRAIYPFVKEILARFPQDVRLVLRYTPLHEGSDEAVRILESARLQQKFEPVLEALLQRQPEWAVHGAPKLDLAWEIAGGAGVDLTRARTDATSTAITAVLKQDVADVEANKVERTPTFLVNGKPLQKVGLNQLLDLVTREVEQSKKGGS